MRLICVDLEMNQPSKKIIQIGAICFQPDDGTIVDTLDCLISPGEPISPKITELTGINDDMLTNAPDIIQGAQTFTNFKLRHSANPIGIVWGAGKSNDVSKIYEESKLKTPFNPRILDTKGVYNMLANAKGGNMRSKSGLKNACESVKIGWDLKFGEPHNALADAYNTYRLYMFLSKCLSGGFNIKIS